MSCLDPGNKLRYLGRARRSHYNKSPLFFHHNQTCVKHGIGRLFEFRLFLTLIYNTDLRDDRGDALFSARRDHGLTLGDSIHQHVRCSLG